jgi:hypothetical protein
MKVDLFQLYGRGMQIRHPLPIRTRHPGGRPPQRQRSNPEGRKIWQHGTRTTSSTGRRSTRPWRCQRLTHYKANQTPDHRPHHGEKHGEDVGDRRRAGLSGSTNPPRQRTGATTNVFKTWEPQDRTATRLRRSKNSPPRSRNRRTEVTT